VPRLNRAAGRGRGAAALPRERNAGDVVARRARARGTIA